MVISIHEYELRPEVSEEDFFRVVREARRRRLFDLPGLMQVHFVRGLRGARKGKLAAIWIYESLDAWEALWGPPDAPRPPEAYPPSWRVWEQELLARVLDRDPDRIRYTAYEVLPL